MIITSSIEKIYIIYMDNYYTSWNTPFELLKMDIMCCGTVRINWGVQNDIWLNTRINTHRIYLFKMAKVDSEKSIIAGHWIDSSIMKILSTTNNNEISWDQNE